MTIFIKQGKKKRKEVLGFLKLIWKLNLLRKTCVNGCLFDIVQAKIIANIAELD